MDVKVYREIEIPTLEQLEAERIRCRKRERYSRTFFGSTAIISFTAVMAIFIATFFMPVMRIYGHSMDPTLEEDQIVLTFKCRDYKAGDIVAFNHDDKLLVKRIIAGASDTVDVRKSGDVYVNGSCINEPYLREKALGECDQSFPLQVGEGQLFLMGDNRSVSVDSRTSSVGCIPENRIEGKVVLCIWPLNSFGIPE